MGTKSHTQRITTETMESWTRENDYAVAVRFCELAGLVLDDFVSLGRDGVVLRATKNYTIRDEGAPVRTVKTPIDVTIPRYLIRAIEETEVRCENCGRFVPYEDAKPIERESQEFPGCYKTEERVCERCFEPSPFEGRQSHDEASEEECPF